MVTTETYKVSLQTGGFTRMGLAYRTHLTARWVIGDSLLDVGCADGSMLRRLAPLVKRAVGVESDPSFSATDLEIHRCYAETMPFADASFSTVICSAARKHFKSTQPAIHEMARVLMARGRLIILDPHPLLVKLGMRLGKFDPKYIRHNDYAWTIAQEMRRSGLSVIHQSNGVFVACVGEKT
jgi:ubiquinone/menaquinone biosynthesis C-methylase UbiE